jgi:hypothetical protein
MYALKHTLDMHTKDVVYLAKLIGVNCIYCIDGRCKNEKRAWKVWSTREEGSTYTDECRAKICEWFELKDSTC